MPAVDFPAVKRLVSLSDVLRLLGWKPSEERGYARRGPCPIHGSEGERSRTFAVDIWGWYCHKCKRGGDQIGLYAAVKGLRQPEAAERLCLALGHKVPWQPHQGPRFRRPRNRKRT